MGVITKKDLYIFRGTYDECMAQKTEDMKIYLAWDTQEIYIGNSVGVKVPYGVPKVLYTWIDKRVNEIKEETLEDTKRLTAELVKSIIDGKIDDYFKELNTTLEETIDKSVEKYGEETLVPKIPTKVSQLKNDANYLTHHQSLTNYPTKEETKLLIDKRDEKFYTKSEIDSKFNNNLTDFENKFSNYYTKTEIIERINLLKSEDEKISTEINSVKTLLNSKVNEDYLIENFYNKAEINKRFEDYSPDMTKYVKNDDLNNKLKNYAKVEDVNNSQFLYLTGSEMEIIDGTDYKNQVVFCTESSTGYKKNKLYFYSDKKFRQLSGGNSEKDLISTTLNLTMTGWPTDAEISVGNITVSNILGEITNKNAIQSAGIYLNNILYAEASISSNISDDIQFSAKNIEIDTSKPTDYEIKISAIPKMEDDYYKYEIKNNNLSKKCSFYQPWLFGEKDNLKHYRPDSKEMECTFKNEIATIYLYTTKKIGTIYADGNMLSVVPFELESPEKITIDFSVNDITGLSYYVYTVDVDDSTKIMKINL